MYVQYHFYMLLFNTTYDYLIRVFTLPIHTVTTMRTPSGYTYRILQIRVDHLVTHWTVSRRPHSYPVISFTRMMTLHRPVLLQLQLIHRSHIHSGFNLALHPCQDTVDTGHVTKLNNLCIRRLSLSPLSLEWYTMRGFHCDTERFSHW